MQTKRLSNLNFYSPVFPSASAVRKKYVYIQKDSKLFFDISLVKEVQEDINSPSIFSNFLTKLLSPFRRPIKKEAAEKDFRLLDAYSLFYEIKKENLFTVEPLIPVHHPILPAPKTFIEKAPLVKERRQSEKEVIEKKIKLSKALKGQLFHAPSGLLYLKLDSKLAKALQDQIDEMGDITEDFEQLYPFHGPHIGVINPSASKKYHLLGSVKEAGKHYFFGIKEVIKEKMYNHPEIDTMWYIKVESESLDQIQKKYVGYTSPLYLILGVKKRTSKYQPFQDMHFRTNLALQFV